MKQSKRNEKISIKIRQQKSQEYKRKEYLKWMSLKEASRAIRRRLEMMDIDNNDGKQSKYRCGEKETTEHIIQCKQVSGEGLNKDWLEETVDIEVIRKVNRWMEEYVEERDKDK